MHKPYRPLVTLRELDELYGDRNEFILVQDNQDLTAFIEYCGICADYAKDITGAVIILNDGDISAAWFSESAAYYALDAWYHPSSYYHDVIKRHFPIYNRRSNPYYHLMIIE